MNSAEFILPTSINKPETSSDSFKKYNPSAPSQPAPLTCAISACAISGF